jgi:hypothetical protein
VWYQKLLLPEHLAQYDRLLVLDGDMVIRKDCPCPDNFVVNNRTAYVSIHQPGRARLWPMQVQQLKLLSELTERKLWRTYIPMMNGGFQLYSPSDVAEAYQLAFELLDQQGLPAHNDWNGDQGILTLLMQTGELSHIQWLPEDFDCIATSICPFSHWIMHAHGGSWISKTSRMDYWAEHEDDNL